MTLTLRISDRAQKDIQNITDYTLGTWGLAQTERYLEVLEDVFDRIVENPALGRARPELKPGARSLVYRNHLVLYQSHATSISVLAVLHQSQDLRHQLKDNT